MVMQNQAQKIEEQVKLQMGAPATVSVGAAVVENIVENVVEFESRDRLIAKQSEEACRLSKNPDFDVFEEIYGLNSFA